MSNRTIGILLIAVVALGALTGAAAAETALDVAVDDTDSEPTVTVTANDTAVANATVNVSVADPANESYTGTGDYVTDDNGTVVLPAAAEDVAIVVTAEHANETVSTTADLEAPAGLAVDVTNTDGAPLVTVTDDDESVENASVNVTTAPDQNVSYGGDGDYVTDENGTVTLPAPDENVTIAVTATSENETVSTTADLTVSADTVEDDQPFGQLVREFIDQLQDREGGIGAAVSDFVTDNNPGNAPDHAGSPGGPSDGNATDAGNASDAPGNAPDHAGSGADGEQGPPDHAGPGNASDDHGPSDDSGPGTGADDAVEDEDENGDSDDADDNGAAGAGNDAAGNGNGSGGPP